MSFLTPWSAVFAAAVAVPLLLALYFLKLRRRALRVPSTLLWEKSFEDLQANAPFQRLRWSLLLALQLLLLALLLVALAQPVIQGGASPTGRIVLIIDRSASMNTRDGDGGGGGGGEDGGEDQTKTGREGAGGAEPALTPTLSQREREMDGGNRGGARLDAAIDAARRTVERVLEAAPSDRPAQIMVVSFGRTARVECGFESSRGILLDALESIEPSDEEGDLEAALQLAGAMAGATAGDEGGEGAGGANGGANGDGASGGADADGPPHVILFSDGGGAPSGNAAGGASQSGPAQVGGANLSLRSGTFEYVRIGPDQAAEVENVGIVSFSARRDYEDAGRVLVFARLLNAGPQPVETAITLTVESDQAELNDSIVMRKVVPGATEGGGEMGGAGEASISAELELPGAAILSLRHDHADSLAADDRAWLVMPAPAKPRIAVVHPSGGREDEFLIDLIESLEPAGVDVMAQHQWEAREAEQSGARSQWDMVVFDRVTARTLPAIPSLTIGASLPGVRWIDPHELGSGQRILSWDRRHPLMRDVSLDTIVYAGFGAYDLPSGATVLASGPQGPVIAALGGGGARDVGGHVAVGFELKQSNWPLHVSSSVFMQNVVDNLTQAGSGQSGVAHRAGEPITLRPRPGANELKIHRVDEIGRDEEADRGTVTIESNESGAMTLGGFARAGLHIVDGAAPPHDRLAVNVLSEAESDIRPRSSLEVNTERVSAISAAQAGPRALWPWLAAAALALLIVEWFVYCARMRGS